MYEGILCRFQKLKKLQRPQTWIACCPAHEDNRPSLSIWINGKGNLWVRCWAGCENHSIFQALGIHMQECFHDSCERPATDPYEPREKSRIECRYDYRDEEGRLLYRSIRWYPKSFTQESVDPDNPGRMRPILGNTRRVLYRLPELVKNPSRLVWVVEGEKDADLLASKGLLATTNVGGAGMGWRDEYSMTLKGRIVCVLPDNDPSGYRHAYMVCGSLMMHGVASLRLITLPGAREKGDVSDWFAMGRTREDLCALAERAVEWRPNSNIVRPF